MKLSSNDIGIGALIAASACLLFILLYTAFDTIGREEWLNCRKLQINMSEYPNVQEYKAMWWAWRCDETIKHGPKEQK